MSLPRGSAHPDFDAAPYEKQYRGDRDRLWQCLNVSAQAAGGEWVEVVTPEGYRIALRLRADGQRQVLIGRSTGWETERDRLDWLRDMSAFRRAFGATGWAIEHGMTKAGGPLVTLVERVITQDFFTRDDAA